MRPAMPALWPGPALIDYLENELDRIGLALGHPQKYFFAAKSKMDEGEVFASARGCWSSPASSNWAKSFLLRALRTRLPARIAGLALLESCVHGRLAVADFIGFLVCHRDSSNWIGISIAQYGRIVDQIGNQILDIPRGGTWVKKGGTADRYRAI
jgi:hypothetical protein